MRLIDADKLITEILTLDLIDDDEPIDKGILNAPTVEAIPIDYMLTKSQEWLIDRSITGSEMKFLRDLIEKWKADETKYLDYKNSLDNWENENGPIKEPSIVPYEIQELDPFKER